MNDMTPPALEIPEGFQRLRLEPNPFIEANGPLYGSRDGGAFRLGLRIEKRHCNPLDICHGGMLMTFCDMLQAIGTNHQANVGRFLLTVNLTCDFIAGAPLGAWLEGRCEVLRVTRNLVFSQALLTADGSAVARSNAILKLGPEASPRFTSDRLFD